MGGILGPSPVYARNDGEVDVSASDVPDAELTARPGLGVLLELDGDCGAAATLHLSAEEDWGTKRRLTVDAARGVPRRVTNLAPARYRVTMSDLPPGCFAAGGEAALDVSQGAPGSWKVRVEKGAALHGALVGFDQSQRGMVVLRPVEPGEGEAVVIELAPGETGRFALDSLRAGRYRVLWAPEETWTSGAWQPEVREWVEVELLAGGVTRLELAQRRRDP